MNPKPASPAAGSSPAGAATRGRGLQQQLAEALAQQAAASEILRMIADSPTEVQPVLDAIAKRAAELCQAPFARILILDGDMLQPRASYAAGGEQIPRAVPVPLSRSSISGRAIHDRMTIHHADVVPLLDDEYPDARSNAEVAGFRAVLAVPMMREGRACGAIFLYRREPGLFTPEQVALVQTFAGQAAIAIENVRLFTELGGRNRDLAEALEQQTATSEILRVISRSQTDVQPVFETIAAAALRLCVASSALVTTFDGTLIHLRALANLDAEGAAALRGIFPRPPSRDNGAARAVLTRAVVVIPDVLTDPDFVTVAASVTSGFRSVLAVPLIREGEPIGAISVGRPEPGPFSTKQVALLRTFADQAVIAIENVRLVRELEARTTQLSHSVGELRALAEVGQAVSSTLDLETVLGTIVSRAAGLTGMDGAIYEYDEAREEFYLHMSDGLPAELVDALRAAPVRKAEGALGQLAVTGEPVQIADIAEHGAYRGRLREILIRLGYRSLLAVPLLREEHLLGGLVVNRKSAGEFSPAVIELLKTFAAQSALAIQNARLFREIELKSRQLEAVSRHKSEFLANMSHELRTPLNAVIGFSEVLSEQIFGELNDKQLEYLQDIHSSGHHLLTLINDVLDLSKIEAGRMELELGRFDLKELLDGTTTLVRERASRHDVDLALDVEEALGEWVADERKVKQIVINLLSNAVKFTPAGGRVTLRARRIRGADRDGVEIAVIDTGVGIAPEEQALVFEEFRQARGEHLAKAEGTGLGLALVKRFVELHGGTVRVESAPGRGSTFAFILPQRVLEAA